MSEQRHGGWDDLEPQSTQEQYGVLPENYPSSEIHPITEIDTQRHMSRRTIRRNWGDNFREFFYWFASTGGFRTLPKILATIAIIILITWIVANRNAIWAGFLGLLSEAIPIVLVIWIMWLCFRNLINPK